MEILSVIYAAWTRRDWVRAKDGCWGKVNDEPVGRYELLKYSFLLLLCAANLLRYEG